MNETSVAAPEIVVTESAARRIAAIMASEGDATLKLRIAVSGGGCSGFQYGFTLDDAIHDDDRLFERAGAVVVIDETSLELLKGSQIDFVEDLAGAAFQIRNPNAQSSCGCGNSFSV
jgi:iron-sulfur cluster insertion protein